LSVALFEKRVGGSAEMPRSDQQAEEGKPEDGE
jgi:hypothetical protein